MLLGVVATGLWSCSSEESVSEPQVSGRTVHITVNVSREGGDAATRTELKDNGDDLGCVWSEGDKLLVTDASGAKKGVLTLSALSVGNDEGTFSGDLENVTNGEQAFNFIYLGKAWSAKGALAADAGLKTNGDKTTFSADYSTQDGSIESLTDKDILAKTTKVNVESGSDYALVEKTVTLERKISFAKFSLSSIKEYKSDLNYDELGYLVVSGEGLMKSATFNVGTLKVEATGGDVLVEKNIKADDNDFYMVLLPGETQPKPIQVTVSDGTDVYTGTYTRATSNVIAEGKYYRKNNGDGTYAGLPLDNWSTKKNPGKIENWSGEDTEIVYDGKLQKVADAGGWVTNVDIYGNGGWGTYYTYKQNAIVGELLSSTNDGLAYFFQWGRWLGFPSSCANTYFRNDNVYGSYPTTSQNLPGNPHNNLYVGYQDDTSLMATYCSGYMGANSGFTREKAKQWSIMFAMVTSSIVGHNDYIYANEECKWEDRSGNPCPDTYRLPSVKELETFIPPVPTVKSGDSYFKVIDGVRYAMQWTKGTDDVNFVDIKSVRSDALNIDEVDFSEANFVRLWAYGYLNSRNRPITRDSKNTLGFYWSNESGKNTLNGINGNGAKYLSIIFNGNEINFSIRVAPRTFGGCVIPFKDPDAKSASVTPWVPMATW